MVYRLGGDEFVVILTNSTDQKSLAVAELLLKELNQSFLVDRHELVITPSIGISLYPEHGEDPKLLFKNADVAMYYAKENGKNAFHFFSQKLNEKVSRRNKLEQALKTVIQEEQLSLLFQPRVELQSGQIIGVEAFVRWKHPELGQVLPEEFIPIAEETGQISLIGEWVLKKACNQNKKWQAVGLPPISLSVNVSVCQFQHRHFLQTIRSILQETKMDPKFLELEITGNIMQSKQESQCILTAIKGLGVKITLDDYGIGYSSLHILKSLPVDSLKIDKTFISGISDPINQSIVKAIIDIGKNLHARVIGEGIENVQQSLFLMKHNCFFGQGPLYSEPVTEVEFEMLIRNGFPSKSSN